MSWLKPRLTKISGTIDEGKRKGPRRCSRRGPFSFSGASNDFQK
jgi:hypothetical protein